VDYKEIFDMLIDNKDILNLNLNIADIIGNTALHLACLYGVEAFWAVKALLDANANATLKNKDGLTPFQLFLIFNSLENLTITDEAILTELGKKSGISFDFDEDPKKK
jgi:ankyrin repeat protein